MRRRLDLAMTLVGDPRIIFLDEPTTGLDPRSRHTMWEIIRELVADGVTIFLTTQYLDEADQLADRIAVLDRGPLVAEGTPAELKRLVPGGHILLQFAGLPTGSTPAASALDAAVPRRGGAHPAGPERRRRHVAARGARSASTTRRSTSTSCRSTPPTSTTCSSPSPTDRPIRPGGDPRMTHASTHTVSDSATMLRRDLHHLIRYPSVTVMLIGMPVVFLLLFVYVLGGTLGAGLGEAVGGRAEYLAYVVPGILLIAIAAVAQGTAISVAMDMTEGIIARFRTMAISRAAVLDRPRRRQHDPDPARPRRRHGRRPRHGLPSPRRRRADWLAALGVLA